jgi:hypothetical protein
MRQRQRRYFIGDASCVKLAAGALETCSRRTGRALVPRALSVLPGLSLVAAMLLTGPLQAADGVLIVQKTTVGDTPRTSQIQIEQNRMRAEVDAGGGARRVVIFDGAKQVLWILDDDRKTYNEMTKADVDRLGGQVQDVMAQVQAQLANMPPAQRAQIEALMKGRGIPGSAAPAPKTEYRKAGTDKVGKWTCDKYEAFQNNQKTSELCTVDPAILGFSLADFEVSRQLGDFFKKVVPQSAEQLFIVGKTEDQGYSGVPVKRVVTLAGRQTTTEITDVSRRTFAEATFAVPATFKKEDFPGLAGRGR